MSQKKEAPLPPPEAAANASSPEASGELQGVRRSWGQRLLSKGKIAASAARLATRRLMGSEGETDGLIGEALAKEMDKMKGMAMKVGQILSYFDGVLPDEVHTALRGLQKGVNPVTFAAMAEVVEETLGQPIDELFDDFSRTPIAAASIGQVYRATYAGKPVAVKVQYPGIWDTIRSDFSLLHKLSRLASVATAVDGPAIVRELQERFGEECDYLREAHHQEAFRAAFSNTPAIQIPAVIDERTRSTVLTSAWCDGDDFYTFQERATQDRRNEVGLLLATFAYQSLFGLGAINADPHPGNYLFPDDQHVVFLDFGCVRHFDAAMIKTERHLARVVIDNRRQDFRDAVLATGMVAKPKSFDYDVHWATLRHQYAPYSTATFRFTPDYIQEGMEFNRPSNPNLRKLAIPPAWIWLQRLQWGLHAVLARLQAEGPFADVYREALDTPLKPLPPPPDTAPPAPGSS